jgi:hypothetical protein
MDEIWKNASQEDIEQDFYKKMLEIFCNVPNEY